MVALALVAALLTHPTCAHGQAADSTAPAGPTPTDLIVGDSTRVRSIGTPTPASDAIRRVGPRRLVPGAGRDSVPGMRSGRFDQPRWVMLRSLVVPGWGQLHNGAWLKAIGVAGVEGMLVLNVVKDGRDLKDLEVGVNVARASGDLDAERIAVDRYNARLDRYVGRQWLLGAVVVYSLVDAYVDAHFVNFRFEFGHDSALPTGAKVAWERRF